MEIRNSKFETGKSKLERGRLKLVQPGKERTTNETGMSFGINRYVLRLMVLVPIHGAGRRASGLLYPLPRSAYNGEFAHNLPGLAVGPCFGFNSHGC
jgi:hypothetical protein